MRAFLAALAVATLALSGCNVLRAAAAGTRPAAKKDCAACAKMCAVAGDAEKNPKGVAACKADCKRTCTP